MSWIFHAPVNSTTKTKTLVIIDNGHSSRDDKSRTSPSFTKSYSNFQVKIPGIAESVQNRMLAKEIIKQAAMNNIATVELHPETNYVREGNDNGNGVTTRCLRVKQIYSQYKSQYDYIYLVSLHTDAASNAIEWKGSPWYMVISKHSNQSRYIREVLETRLKPYFGKLHDSSSYDLSSVGIVSNVPCESVLVENGSHSVQQDVECWLADEWKTATETQAKAYFATYELHPFYAPNKWLSNVARAYVQAFLDIEHTYIEAAKPVSRSFEQAKSEQIKGDQDAVPQTRLQKTLSENQNLPFWMMASRDISEDDFTDVETLLKFYYDFSDSEGKRVNGLDKLTIADEKETFLKDNWIILISHISEEQLREKMQNLEDQSQIQETTYDSAKNQFPDLVDFVSSNVKLGVPYKFYKDKLQIVSPTSKDVSFLDTETNYLNPFMRKAVLMHLDDIAVFKKTGKQFPRAFAWVCPQSRSLYNAKSLILNDDLISCDFTRGLDKSTFSLSLKPVKAVFVKNEDMKYGLWVKQGEVNSANNFNAKSFAENRDYYYDKVINPGDVIYITLLDHPISDELASRILHAEENTEENKKDALYIDFIGVVDKVEKAYSIGQSITESITISGRSLLKFYEDDTVFFQTANLAYTSDAIKNDSKGDGVPLDEADLSRAQESIKDTSETQYNTVKNTLEVTRVANTNLDLAQLISCDSVLQSLNHLLDKLKLLPQLFNTFTKFGQQTVSVTERIMRDFDQSLQYRTYYSSRLSTMEGSIWDFLKQLSPEPFTEIWGDTFPPMSKEEITKVLGESNMNDWKFPDTEDFIGKKSDTSYKWDSNQIFHIIVRNSLMSPEQFNFACSQYAFEIPSDFITSFRASITDAQMYSAFQVIPRSWFDGDQVSQVQAFPPVLFMSLAQRYGFKFAKVESSYFTQTKRANKADLDVNGTIFAYAEKDLRKYCRYMLGNAFYETGTITTIPLRHIHPGMILCLPDGGANGPYYAYIKSVKQTRGSKLTQAKTTIEFERGLSKAGHELIADLVKIESDPSKSFIDSEARSVEFYVDVFEKLLSKRYGLTSTGMQFKNYNQKQGSVSIGKLTKLEL